MLLPPEGALFDYQLAEVSPLPANTEIVERDGSDIPAPGVYSICYINGFQSQPGVAWPDSDLLHSASGALVVDPAWPDEHIFDIRTASNRTHIAAQLAVSVRRCAQVGFKAVEFDNLDSYTRSEGALTLADATVFAGVLVAIGHGIDLAVAQKNTSELGIHGRDDIRFDFAMVEECDRDDECAAYTNVYQRRVYNVEYTDNLRGTASEVCARARTSGPVTIIRDRNLVQAGTADHVYRACGAGVVRKTASQVKVATKPWADPSE